MQRSGKPSGILLNRLLCLLADALCRIYRDTVAGMDPRPLDMLHDPRDQDICAVADSIHLDLLSHQVFVHQDRMILCDPVNDADELFDVMIANGNLHSLASQHIGWPYQHRISQAVCHFLGFFGRIDRSPGRTRDLALLQDLVK